MSRIRCSTGVGAILLALALLASREPVVGLAPDTLPSALTDSEFWSLSERISEPDGFFRSNSGSSDNLLSNEDGLSAVAAALGTRVKPSGIYLGVGPEQNFTYIAATRPRLAFITDIRRGNLHLHLLYKALFEISNTRADFVARLFSRKRPAGLTSTSTAPELMNAYMRVAPDDEVAFRVNLKAVTDHLNLKDAIHVGHSTGGGQVVHYLARHGDNDVAMAAIISAVPPLMVKTPANPLGLPKSVFDDLQAQLAANRAKFYYDLPAGPFYGFNRPGVKTIEPLIWNWWRQGMMGGAKAGYDGIVAFSQTDFTEDLKKINVPVLVMHSEDDQIVPYRASGPLSAKLLKNGTLKTYKDLPHGMITTHADVINADLLAFIKG